MGALEVFTSGEWSVRTVPSDEGEPWFVATDIARILGYRDAATAVRMLDDDERGTRSVRTPGGDQQMTVISEAGLYSLIVRSQVIAAKAFRRWVTHDVLPAIRRTGTYSAVEPQAIPTHAEALRGWADALEAKELAQEQLAIAAPKVEAYEAFMDSDGLLSMGAAAQALDFGRTTFFRELKRLGILQADNRPYQRYAHHFAVKVGSYEDNHGTAHPTFTTRIRPEGLDYLRRRLTSNLEAI